MAYNVQHSEERWAERSMQNLEQWLLKHSPTSAPEIPLDVWVFQGYQVNRIAKKRIPLAISAIAHPIPTVFLGLPELMFSLKKNARQELEERFKRQIDYAKQSRSRTTILEHPDTHQKAYVIGSTEHLQHKGYQIQEIPQRTSITLEFLEAHSVSDLGRLALEISKFNHRDYLGLSLYDLTSQLCVIRNTPPEQHEEWLDTPNTAFRNKTPRQESGKPYADWVFKDSILGTILGTSGY